MGGGNNNIKGVNDEKNKENLIEKTKEREYLRYGKNSRKLFNEMARERVRSIIVKKNTCNT